MDIELPLRAVKALLEVAGFGYLGQGLVAVFAGARRNENIVYQVFSIITSPVTRFTRFVMPRAVLDRFIPFIGFGLVFWAWFAILIAIAAARRGIL